MDHLSALRLRLSREKSRLTESRNDSERALRSVWVRQIEKEISDELRFLGLTDSPPDAMTDDELLAELEG